MPASQESDIISRRNALARIGQTILTVNTGVAVVEHGPQILTGAIALIEQLRLAEARNGKWIQKTSGYKTDNGIVVPIKKITIGDSLGRGFVENNTPEHPPDGIVTRYVNEYLSQDSWTTGNYAEIGATTIDTLAKLSPGSPVVADLKKGSHIDVTISLLGNDFGNYILRDFGSFGQFEAQLQGPFDAPKAFEYLSQALGEYKTNVKKVLKRIDDIRQEGADIKRVILQGPPNFGMAKGVSVRLPQQGRREYKTEIINLQGNKTAQLFGTLLAIELFLGQNDVLEEIGDTLGMECLLTDNLNITTFAKDQHLLPDGYAQMAFNQTKRFIGEFDGRRQNFNEAMQLHHLDA